MSLSRGRQEGAKLQMKNSILPSEPATFQKSKTHAGRTVPLSNRVNDDEELVYAVTPIINDDGTEGVLYMQDLIMCGILGLNKLPQGYEVGFLDGNTLNNTSANLVLQRIGEGRNAHS
jgi:hypothetical protein